MNDINVADLNRIAEGVAKMLRLSDVEKLKEYAIEILTVGDAYDNICKTLIDSDAWDYGALGSTFSYYYAAGVVAWLYLYEWHLYKQVPHSPLLSDDVAVAILKYLVTYTASYIRQTIQDKC